MRIQSIQKGDAARGLGFGSDTPSTAVHTCIGQPLAARKLLVARGLIGCVPAIRDRKKYWMRAGAELMAEVITERESLSR